MQDQQLLNKDFYHTAASECFVDLASLSCWKLTIRVAKIDVKSKAPNGVSFNVKGTSAHEGPTSGSVSLLTTKDHLP